MAQSNWLMPTWKLRPFAGDLEGEAGFARRFALVDAAKEGQSAQTAWMRGVSDFPPIASIER